MVRGNRVNGDLAVRILLFKAGYIVLLYVCMFESYC